MLVLLLLILFGITEFSRAWYTKNSLKNAVRTGARIAVVTPGLNVTATCPADPTQLCGDNPAPAVVENAVRSSPGATNATVYACFQNKTSDPNAKLDMGDTVKVCATTTFDSVVSSSFFPWLQNITITTDASMRYE